MTEDINSYLEQHKDRDPAKAPQSPPSIHSAEKTSHPGNSLEVMPQKSCPPNPEQKGRNRDHHVQCLSGRTTPEQQDCVWSFECQLDGVMFKKSPTPDRMRSQSTGQVMNGGEGSENIQHRSRPMQAYESGAEYSYLPGPTPARPPFHLMGLSPGPRQMACGVNGWCSPRMKHAPQWGWQNVGPQATGYRDWPVAPVERSPNHMGTCKSPPKYPYNGPFPMRDAVSPYRSPERPPRRPWNGPVDGVFSGSSNDSGISGEQTDKDSQPSNEASSRKDSCQSNSEELVEGASKRKNLQEVHNVVKTSGFVDKMPSSAESMQAGLLSSKSQDGDAGTPPEFPIVIPEKLQMYFKQQGSNVSYVDSDECIRLLKELGKANSRMLFTCSADQLEETCDPISSDSGTESFEDGVLDNSSHSQCSRRGVGVSEKDMKNHPACCREVMVDSSAGSAVAAAAARDGSGPRGMEGTAGKETRSAGFTTVSHVSLGRGRALKHLLALHQKK